MNQEKTTESKKLTIYYDGTCPMCTVVMNKVADSESSSKFNFNNIKKDILPENITKKEAEKEIHVIDVDGKIYRNSDAIFKILSQYKNLKFLSKIGKLTLFRPVFKLGYKIIAANRYFIFGQAKKIFWLKIVVALGFISGLLVSSKLFLGNRAFPHIPVFPALFQIPSIVESILSVFLISCLFYIISSSKPKKAILLSILVFLFLALFDQMRWQPWFFQYVFMMAVLGIFSWNHKDDLGIEKALNSCRLIVASIYFFSGLQKVNIEFMQHAFPWVVQPLTALLPPFLHQYVYATGVLVPFVEMAIGMGLLTNTFRKYAVAGALATIAFILCMLGPFGRDWNIALVPWNLVMVCLVPILFWNVKDFSTKDIFFGKNNFLHKAVVLFFVVMPFLSFFNIWDSNLSFTLYSANVNSAQIYITESLKNRLPAELSGYVIPVEPSRSKLDFFTWSMDEFNLPPYPETRAFKQIAKRLCEYSSHEEDLTLIIKGKPTLFNSDRPSIYNCSDLQ